LLAGGTRRDLISLDISYALSFSQQGPPSLYGTTNYYLPILPYRPDQNIPVRLLLLLLLLLLLNLISYHHHHHHHRSVLYFFDSGGGQLPEAIQGHQVEWYVSMSKALRQKANDQVLPSIAFFHIPLEEYNSSQKTVSQYLSKKLGSSNQHTRLFPWQNCFGQADDGVTPVAESNGALHGGRGGGRGGREGGGGGEEEDTQLSGVRRGREKAEDTYMCFHLCTGLFNAFQKMGDVKATFVGHDHGNDWCCLYEGIRLCFGRHTGTSVSHTCCAC